jgi:hypothetical protein
VSLDGVRPRISSRPPVPSDEKDDRCKEIKKNYDKMSKLSSKINGHI